MNMYYKNSSLKYAKIFLLLISCRLEGMLRAFSMTTGDFQYNLSEELDVTFHNVQ